MILENTNFIIEAGLIILALGLLLRANYTMFDIQIMFKRLCLYIFCIGYFIFACALG